MTKKKSSASKAASLADLKAKAAAASKPPVSQTSLKIRQSLLSWFEAENITFDEELISIEVADDQPIPSTTVSSKATVSNGPVFWVKSKEAIDEGMTIASIPKISVLSIKNCGVADIIGGCLARMIRSVT
jgi:hypothetical protein